MFMARNEPVMKSARQVATLRLALALGAATRGPSARKRRSQYPGASYHVVNRRDRREDILVVNCLPVASIQMSFS
jgi:hypothetical protein